MFTSLTNIDSAFRKIKLFVIIYTLCLTAIAVYIVKWSYDFAQSSREKIYVLANGESLMLALSKNMNENRPVEARQHVKDFHRFFFKLDPDMAAIENNVKKALVLADKSAFSQYSNLKEQGYYSAMISGNVSQDVIVDSVAVDFTNYPYKFTFKGKQQIIRSTSIVTRSLVTEGYLRNVARSDNNSHGFLIEKWQVLENKDLEVKQR
jgi:conjugative transposon TraK protein